VIRSGRQTGYILLPVIVVITLVAAIALLMNTESALESNTAGSELDAQQAQYVAEAGLNHALWLNRQQGCGPYGNLTDEPLDNDKYTTALTTDLGSTTAFTISVDQDSWIRSDQPTVNKGTDLKLHTRNEAAGTERPLLRYDLSPIAAKAPILSATAWFYITNAHAAGPIDIHLTSADWNENDATWDSMSTNMDKVVLATIPSQPANNIWIQVNLTSQVQAWVNGQTNFGITLNSPVDGVHGQYDSRESANPPYLEVVVGTPPTSPAVLKAVGTLANGVSRTISRNDVVLYQHPQALLHLQPGAVAGEDAEIWEQSPNNNYGAAAETWVSSAASDTTRSLLRFNMGAISPGARILEATLSLERQSGAGADQPVSAHRITNPWSEDSVTWNSRKTGLGWDTAGGDFDNTAIATTPVGPLNQRYAWNITPLVQGWVDGSYPNDGVALVAAIAGMPGERFYTSDDADPTRWPSLSVTYACTCGEVCVASQGNGNLLMVVINPTTLVAEDQQAKDLFESWGYTVSLLSESANQSSYDAAVAVNDVVFISETVNSNSVGTKLQNAPIGVVSQDGDYNPDLGLATGSTLKIGTDIDITSTDHYITRVFPLGPLPIYAASMEQLVTSGALTADQQTLAEIGGDASLLVLDKGNAMEGGGNAVGRRVILPLGTRYRFNWDYLNANGRVLVQRSLEWGIGVDKVSSANLLLVVVNPSSLTTQETAKKTLFESWGYAVNLIDESDNQTDFDAAVAVNDVVYITEDVTSGSVNTKLVNAAIGVVTEEANLSDEFGFSTGINWGSATDLKIENTHYITQPLVAGIVTILTATESLAGLVGPFGPDIEVIGGSVAGSGLATLEPGDSILGGGAAAGRRVFLPWGGDDFNVNHLNADGLTILQRSLEWGAGAGCVSMQPLLLVVGDATTLSSKDDGMKTLMESWCYSVTVIDDGDSQANFNTAAAAADVVYVSGTTSGPSLQDKLTGSPTPIVNEINGKLDNFGFSSSTALSVTASAFSVTSASHYISEPFAGGPVTFFTTDLAMPVPGGTLAPDLQIVGETTGTIPALVTLETGAQRWDGNPAPARRVHLPFTNAEPSQLTADGETLMRRSIEWAADIDTGPIAHWKLDDGSGITAIDSVGGHHGTLTNPPAWVAGTLGDALEFDGSNDYVDLTSDAELDDVFVGGATVMAWIEPAGWGENGYGRVFDKSSSPSATGDGWVIRMSVDNGGIINFGQGFTGGRGWWKIPNASISLDTWQHIAIAYDASSTANDPIIYLDGSPIAVTEVDTPSGTLRSDASINLRLGNYAGGTTHTFDGIIDDARIYDRMLSAAEIADIAAEGGGGGGTLDIKVAGGNDDAEQLTSDGTMDLVSTDLELADNLAATGQPSDIVGIRFVNVTIPQGETIDNAYIQFQVDETNSGASSLTIEAEAVDDAAQFTTADYDITSRPRTTASVLWTPPVWTTVGERGPDQRTVDISSLVQEIVNRPGWSSGNSLAIIISGGGTRTAEAYEGDPVGAPELHIDYGGGGGGGPPTIFEVPITTGSDDAEERVSNGNVNNNSSDLELVTDGSNNQLVGMRFTSVTIPNGSTISSAYIQFQVDETNSGAVSVNIQGQAIDDAPTFTTGNSNISSRGRTSATVPWAPVPWTTVGEAGPDQQTPNIATVIQEIVNRPGWASGNDLVIIMTGSGERTAESYNGDSSGAALLHIEY